MQTQSTNTAATQRTPGPWSFRVGGKNRRGAMEIHRQDGEQAVIVAKGVKAPYAATICRACNAHDELVAALRSIADVWPHLTTPAGTNAMAEAMAAKARAALAKVGAP